MELYPRIEAALPNIVGGQPLNERVPTGVEGLDQVFGGALVRGSTSLLLGSSGSGKSTTSLQFALEGARRGEPSLFYGFFSPVDALRTKATRLGHRVADYEKDGLLSFEWRSPSEAMLDREAHDVLNLVRERKIQRLVLDGFPGFRSADEIDRISPAFAAVLNHLSSIGVTTFVTDETRELFVRDVHVPTSNVSALFHNIVFLRQVERDAALVQLIGVLKTRDSEHDHRLWELAIGEAGVRLLRPFAPSEHGLMRGGGSADA